MSDTSVTETRDKTLREEGGPEERYDISRARVFARISTVFATLLSNYFEREDTYKYVACRAQYTTSALADDKHAVSGLTLVRKIARTDEKLLTTVVRTHARIFAYGGLSRDVHPSLRGAMLELSL